MMAWANQTVLRTDFNHQDKSGRLVASKDFAAGFSADLEEGSSVLVIDVDGNRVAAYVDRIDGNVVRLKPVWSTWEPIVSFTPGEFAYTFDDDSPRSVFVRI